MIVPVKRWASFATFGLAKPARKEKNVNIEREREQGQGLLEGYEKMWAAQADLMLRNLAK